MLPALLTFELFQFINGSGNPRSPQEIEANRDSIRGDNDPGVGGLLIEE